MKSYKYFDKFLSHILYNYEGCYSNNPNDPGAETILGIASKYHPKTFNNIMKIFENHNIPKEKIDDVCKKFLNYLYFGNYLVSDYKIFVDLYFEVSKFYFNEYYSVFDKYLAPPRNSNIQNESEVMGIILFLFDSAINCGIKNSVKFLQNAMRESFNVGITVDGVLGPQTASIFMDNVYCDEKDENIYEKKLNAFILLSNVCAERKLYYKEIVNKNSKLEVFYKGWLNRVNRLFKHIVDEYFLRGV